MNSFILFTFLLTLSTLAVSEIYKVKDPVTGKIIFTDRPGENLADVEKLELGDINTQQAIPIPKERKGNQEHLANSSLYTEFYILLPEHEQTIPPEQSTLTIQVNVSPELQDGDMIQIFMDGDPATTPEPVTSFQINNLEQGTHQIQAKIITTEGKTRKLSQAINIHAL